jgi:uncharacterized membrane protein
MVAVRDSTSISLDTQELISKVELTPLLGGGVKLVGPIFFAGYAVFYVLAWVSMKLAAENLSISSLYSLHTNLFLPVSALAIALAAIIWVQVLKHYPLSIAYPASSLSGFIIFVIAAFYFNEGATIQNVIGLTVISFGLLILSSSAEDA